MKLDYDLLKLTCNYSNVELIITYTYIVTDFNYMNNPLFVYK